MTPRYPEIRVCVTDNKPLDVTIERVDVAMRRAKISSASRHEFKGGVPRGYAMAVDYARRWVETD
jgi:hypothetical protein